MSESDQHVWPVHVIRFLKDQLSLEYGSLSGETVARAIEAAQAEVTPREGWVKLLAVARKKLIH